MTYADKIEKTGIVADLELRQDLDELLLRLYAASMQNDRYFSC